MIVILITIIIRDFLLMYLYTCKQNSRQEETISPLASEFTCAKDLREGEAHSKGQLAVGRKGRKESNKPIITTS